MQTAIIIIWSIGLIVALIATVIILKQVTIVLRALKGIHRLGIITRDAARGIEANVEAVPRLPSLDEPARELTHASTALREAVERVERRLSMLADARLPGGK